MSGKISFLSHTIHDMFYVKIWKVWIWSLESFSPQLKQNSETPCPPESEPAGDLQRERQVRSDVRGRRERGGSRGGGGQRQERTRLQVRRQRLRRSQDTQPTRTGN